MVITYKQLHKVSFPIYPLQSDDWSFEDGLLRIGSEILDDRNMPGDTLGIRRIQSPFKNLYPLKRQINDINGIVQNSFKTYVDSKGRVFSYEKTVYTTLKYYKIQKVVRKGAASVLWLHGVNFPFKIPRPPSDEMTYAGVLHLSNNPWILYEYSETRKNPRRKKV